MKEDAALCGDDGERVALADLDFADFVFGAAFEECADRAPLGAELRDIHVDELFQISLAVINFINHKIQFGRRMDIECHVNLRSADEHIGVDAIFAPGLAVHVAQDVGQHDIAVLDGNDGAQVCHHE